MIKKVVLGLLALTTLGTLAVPAMGDEVNVQNVQQINTQEGDLNRAFQESSQTIRSSRGREASDDVPSSYGNVQDIYQDVYQSGSQNSVRQTNVQKIEMRSRFRR